MSINRSEIVARAAGKSTLTQSQINEALTLVLDEVATAAATGEKVVIPGWVSVERTERAARTGRNPQTGETIEIPAGYGVKVSAGSTLKGIVTGKA